jgi:hypothetical protein
MKCYLKVVSFCIGIFILFLAPQVQAARYYTTTEQPQEVVGQIKAAPEFGVLPIDYSAIDPKKLGYTNNAEWNADKNGVPQAFADAFPALLKEANISNKKVSMIQKTDKISKGILAEVTVSKIILNWNAWTGRPDEYICKITFTNAATGQKLYSGIVNINSLSGNLYAQGWGNSFGRRMQAAAFNMAWVLTKIMADGKLEPADY